jgi:REP element-mobilizing transposase RayT
MDTVESLNHSVWDCKYHVVFIPKCRRKTLYGDLRKYLGEVFRRLAQQKESRIEEGHLLSDHVHMLIAIPPKYAVAQVVGFIKGKSDPFGARVRGAQEELRGAALLGARVLRVDGRSRRGPDPRIHSEAGTRGRAPGPIGALALSGHRHGGPEPSGPR